MRAEASRRRGRSPAVIGAIALFAGLVGFSWYGGSATVSSVPGVDIGAAFAAAAGRRSPTAAGSGWRRSARARDGCGDVVTGERCSAAAVPRALVAALAGASALLIAYRVVHHQPSGSGRVSPSTRRAPSVAGHLARTRSRMRDRRRSVRCRSWPRSREAAGRAPPAAPPRIGDRDRSRGGSTCGAPRPPCAQRG